MPTEEYEIYTYTVPSAGMLSIKHVEGELLVPDAGELTFHVQPGISLNREAKVDTCTFDVVIGEELTVVVFGALRNSIVPSDSGVGHQFAYENFQTEEEKPWLFNLSMKASLLNQLSFASRSKMATGTKL
jgi:hypothetical protein